MQKALHAPQGAKEGVGGTPATDSAVKVGKSEITELLMQHGTGKMNDDNGGPEGNAQQILDYITSEDCEGEGAKAAVIDFVAQTGGASDGSMAA